MEKRQEPVYLLTYDHGGYILWGPHFEERFREAVAWLDRYPSFKIGLDNESFAYDKYAQSDPGIIAALREALAKYGDRLAVGSSTYGQPLSVFISEESNVRQLVYAVRTNLLHLGETPGVYAISEHALHSQIPQLAAQVGYKAAIMRTHFMMYGYNPTYNAGYGTWIGMDGTEIPTVPTYEGEGAEFGITTMDNWVLTRWPDQTDLSLEDFAGRFAHISPLLASRYDDIVLRCEKLAAHVEGNPAYRWITLEEIPALFGASQMEFHPGPNEFVVRMPWGYCGNTIFNGCREAETQAALAERVNAFSVLLGGIPMEQELEQAWKNALIAQHHDIQICGLMGDAGKYIPASLEASRNVLKASMENLATRFTRTAPHSLLALNPNSWPVTELVEREISYPRGGSVEQVGVFWNGKPVPCQITVLDGKQSAITRAKVRFQAELDGLTAACYSIEPRKGISCETACAYDPDTGILRTPDYTIRLDEYGIRSLQMGRNTIIEGPQGSLFAGVIDGAPQISRGGWSVVCSGFSAQAEYVGYVGSIALRFQMEIRGGLICCSVCFWHKGERIGSTVEAGEFKQNTNGFIHEDKLRLLLNTSLQGEATGIRDLPFAVAETGDRYIQGNYWTAVSDGITGLAIFNRGAMCMVREERAVSLPLAYANDYVWGERYLYGAYSHEFAILPFAGNWQEADLHRKALAYQYPFPTLPLDGLHDGQEKDLVRFLETEGTGGERILLSALYPEDGGVNARFYETAGRPGDLFPYSGYAANAGQVNLLGGPLEDTGDGFGPWKIKTWKLVPHTKTQGGKTDG